MWPLRVYIAVCSHIWQSQYRVRMQLRYRMCEECDNKRVYEAIWSCLVLLPRQHQWLWAITTATATEHAIGTQTTRLAITAILRQTSGSGAICKKEFEPTKQDCCNKQAWSQDLKSYISNWLVFSISVSASQQIIGSMCDNESYEACDR